MWLCIRRLLGENVALVVRGNLTVHLNVCTAYVGFRLIYEKRKIGPEPQNIHILIIVAVIKKSL